MMIKLPVQWSSFNNFFFTKKQCDRVLWLWLKPQNSKTYFSKLSSVVTVMPTCSLSSHIPVRWYNDEPASINQFCNIPVEACRLCPMWLALPLSFFLLFVDPSTSCCCSSVGPFLPWVVPTGALCGCNFFNCNCDTEDGGYCIRVYKVYLCASWERNKCTKLSKKKWRFGCFYFYFFLTRHTEFIK